MHLRNFDQYIDAVILARGKLYEAEGHIATLEEVDDRVYEAEVEGSELYEVCVELDEDGGIIEMECDCPYDLGPACKHQVAVLFRLRDMLKTASAGGSAAAVDKPERIDVERLLEAREKSELVAFLVKLAREADDIRQRIVLQFADANEEQELASSRRLIRSYVKRAADRHGFVDYRGVAGAVQGAEMVLDKARDTHDDGECVRAVKLSLCVVEEMVELLESCDDSDGNVGGMIEDSVALIDEIATTEEVLSVAESEAIFRLLLDAYEEPLLCDWRMALLAIAAHVTVTPELRTELEDRLSILEKDRSLYDAEEAAKLRHDLILRCDGAAAAEEYRNSRLDQSEFREMAIREALSRQQFERAIELAREGERQDSASGFPGLVRNWKELRYEAYRASGQLELQRELAADFAAEGDFGYYLKWKQTYEPAEWKTVYPRLLERLESGRGTHRDVYTRILVEEEENERLLAYVRERPTEVERFYPQLVDEYAEDVYRLFADVIARAASVAGTRKDYQRVCGTIRTLVRAGGRATAGVVVRTLLQQYARRPAFCEELRLVKVQG